MGIYGLTSYVAQHQSQLLDDCKLHNSTVLVDGNSAASLIYSNLTQSNHAFGGDYDRYARSSRDFVQLLRKCNLRPIFVFDGGYEQRKLKTVLERIRMNIMVCGQYKNKFRESKSFPLMLRDTFRAVLQELGVTVVQCDFEADNELVVLSRVLACPLISYDSDFCFTDVQYIPFTTIDFKAVRLKKSQPKYYLPCKTFNVDKFLDRFGGAVDKCLLPLLSCVLGNDYIPRNTFEHFLQLDRTASFEGRIAKVVRWLAGIVSVDEAVDQMVAFVQNHKTAMKKKIHFLLFEYNRTTSYLLEFIPQEIVEASLCNALQNLSIAKPSERLQESMKPPPNQPDLEASLVDTEDEECASSSSSIIILDTEEYEIPCSDDEDVIQLEESQYDPNNSTVTEQKIENESQTNVENVLENSAVDSVADDSLLTDFETSLNDSSLNPACEPELCFKVPEWFSRKYRRGIITPNLINLINFQRWFIPSQSEDYFGKPSHEISLPILQAVVGIVLGKVASVEKVKCHARKKGMYLGVYDITPILEVQGQPLPSLLSVASMPIEERASVLVDCLGLPKNTNLRVFPREWRLYMLILMYWKNHCKQPAVNESHIRAVIVCLIYLSVIDAKIGFVRLASDLKRMKKEKKRSCKKTSSGSEVQSADTANASNSLDGKDPPIDANMPANSQKAEVSRSIDTGEAVSISNEVVDPQTHVIDLMANSLGVIKDTLPIDTDRVGISNEVVDPHTRGTSLTANSPDGDPLPGDFSQESTCKSVPVPATDADNPVDSTWLPTDRNPALPTEYSGTELFTDEGEYDSVQDFLDRISEEDCYMAAMALLNYHQVSPTLLKNRKDFDVKLIHSLAQLQHCIQSVCILNSALDFPFTQCQTHSCFSGTFLYNFYSELNNRKLADGYVTRTVLAKAGSIIALYRYLISSWEAVTAKKVIRPKFQVKKKKKSNSSPVKILDEPVEPKYDPEAVNSKKVVLPKFQVKKKNKKSNSSPVKILDEPVEQESYRDPDNIYSMLPEE